MKVASPEWIKHQQGGRLKTCKLWAWLKSLMAAGSKYTETGFEPGLNLTHYLLNQELATLPTAVSPPHTGASKPNGLAGAWRQNG